MDPAWDQYFNRLRCGGEKDRHPDSIRLDGIIAKFTEEDEKRKELKRKGEKHPDLIRLNAIIEDVMAEKKNRDEKWQRDNVMQQHLEVQNLYRPNRNENKKDSS
jgi:hypothetical protein